MCGDFCRCELDYGLERFKIWASSVNSIGRDMCAFCAFIGAHPKTEVAFQMVWAVFFILPFPPRFSVGYKLI